MKKRMITAALLLFAAVAVSHATDATASELPEHSQLVRLAGSWSGSGHHFGLKATMRMKWESVLEGKFTRLSLRVEAIAKEGGKQVFEGNAYYRQTEPARFEANWFDSHGDALPVKARQEGEALIAVWGDPAKVEGRSTYKLIEAGKKLEVIDEFHAKDGTWKEIGRFVLNRSAN